MTAGKICCSVPLSASRPACSQFVMVITTKYIFVIGRVPMDLRARDHLAHSLNVVLQLGLCQETVSVGVKFLEQSIESVLDRIQAVQILVRFTMSKPVLQCSQTAINVIDASENGDTYHVFLQFLQIQLRVLVFISEVVSCKRSLSSFKLVLVNYAQYQWFVSEIYPL
jgi:hypothetical protein